MKQNWKIFETIISGVQIILGLLILSVIAITIWEYYSILWINPLIDHKSILELSFKKNYILFTVSIISIFSGFLLIKNSIKGWILSIITWTMYIILFVFSFYRISLNESSQLNLNSKIIMYIVVIAFVAILVVLNNSEFKQKYKPTNENWLIITSIIVILTLAKFVYS